MSLAVIGIGTNMGDRAENIRQSLESLSLLPDTEVLKESSIYETKPWGYTEQANFYNCCVVVNTSLSPRALLGALLGIEASMGRVRRFQNGPRVIDLDLLLYENESYSDRELTLPHPRIPQRAFVLYPLKELFDDGRFFSYDFIKYLKDVDKNDIIGVI